MAPPIMEIARYRHAYRGSKPPMIGAVSRAGRCRDHNCLETRADSPAGRGPLTRRPCSLLSWSLRRRQLIVARVAAARRGNSAQRSTGKRGQGPASPAVDLCAMAAARQQRAKINRQAGVAGGRGPLAGDRRPVSPRTGRGPGAGGAPNQGFGGGILRTGSAAEDQGEVQPVRRRARRPAAGRLASSCSQRTSSRTP